MLKHLENMDRHLASIDGSLAAMAALCSELKEHGLLEKFNDWLRQQRGDASELEEWLSKQEAMDYLSIKKSTYYRWVAAGILEPRGKAGEDKFLKGDLKALAEERKRRKRRKPAGNGVPV